MVHKKNFVCAIKVDGKVLRESSDRVELPFGSEYSVMLKNLDSVRMQARISIDGKQATGWLIIEPGRSIDVERFVEDLDRGNRFKFIEMTDRIEQHRGIKLEDGLVRVEFRREKLYEAPKTVEHHTYHHYYPGGCYGWPVYPSYPGYPRWTLTSTTMPLNSSSAGNVSLSRSNFSQSNNTGASSTVRAMNMTRSVEVPVNDMGITVPGSLSEQKFVSVQGFETERSEVVVLHLVGKKAGEPVKVVKTVHMMLQCETCGKTSKSSAKFCKECGTSLEKV